MKWFKHDTNSLHDAKIEKLIMKYGVEGYGLYFACVEIIAGSLSPDNFNFELEHDAEIIGYKFKIDTLKVEKIMEYCVKLGLFELSNNKVTCLKLAKRLDISTSNNPEIKKILNNSNYQKLLVANSRLDKSRLEEIRIDKKKERGFKKPTVEEIQERIDEMNYDMVAMDFFNFYESKNWMVGKNKMAKWKSALGGWNSRNKPEKIKYGKDTR